MKNYTITSNWSKQAVTIARNLILNQIGFHFVRKGINYEFSVPIEHAKLLNLIVNKVSKEKKKLHADKWIENINFSPLNNS